MLSPAAVRAADCVHRGFISRRGLVGILCQREKYFVKGRSAQRHISQLDTRRIEPRQRLYERIRPIWGRDGDPIRGSRQRCPVLLRYERTEGLDYSRQIIEIRNGPLKINTIIKEVGAKL